MPAATCVCLSSVARICVKILAAIQLSLSHSLSLCIGQHGVCATYERNSINHLLLLLLLLNYFASLLLTLSRFHLTT